MRSPKNVRLRLCYVVVLSLLSAAKAQAGGGASITLQPVPPKTVPPSSYPPGTTIVGQEIRLGSLPARVWLEVHITGWAPETLRTVQATISATDPEDDGGGYSGENAICNYHQVLGLGDLAPALQPCNVDADCRSAMNGTTVPCQAGEPSRCLTWDGGKPPWFPPGQFCEHAFQDLCDAQWGGNPVAVIPPIDLLTLNSRFGFAADPGEELPDFAPSYIGTLVLDVPANAKGIYTIDFDESQTFMQNSNNPPNNNIPVSLFPAKITIPCGRCCSGYASGQIECVDHVADVECTDADNQVFTEGEHCPERAGPDCAECAINSHCDDGIACTLNLCVDQECVYTPDHVACDDGLFCNGQEICDAAFGCGSGQPRCELNECDEVADECRAEIPTVSNWGLVSLILAVLIAAKVRYNQRPLAV